MILNSKMYKVTQIIEQATSIFIPKIETGFPAQNMNLRLQKTKDLRFGGFGIYSIAYDHPKSGLRLIYLGSYAGKSGDVSKGDVRTERWSKHIGTANLLLKNLTILSEKNYREQKRLALIFYKNNDKFKEVYRSSFLGIGEDSLKYIFRDRMNVSRNRLGFAIQNLLDTNNSTPHSLESITEIISRFHMFYWKITPDKLTKKIEINAKLKKLERELINRYMEKLPMNNEFPEKDQAENLYFHYNPGKLILIDSCEFRKYVHDIYSGLECLDNYTSH